MSDHWDFYFANVNEKLASLFIDVGLRETAPNEHQPWLLWIWLYFESPREDGLSSPEEFEVLGEIEDVLTEALAASLDAIPVGRITTDGHREFYFYSPQFTGFEDAVSRCMKRFPQYRWDADYRHDAEWSQYRNVLYPSPRDWQCIQNRHVIEQLKEHGDRLEKQRIVSHWAYFPDEASRSLFVDSIEKLGYNVTMQEINTESDTPCPMSVGFEKVDHVDWDSINQVTLELFELAERHSGEYDGWETSVEKDD